MDENKRDPRKDVMQVPTAIVDSELDPEEIMDVIRQRISEARAAKPYAGQNLSSFGGVSYPEKPDDITYDLDLYHHLDLVNKEWSHTGTTFDFGENAIGRLPVLGNIWRWVKMKLHSPALFYANRAGERQAAINRELVEVLNRLLVDNQGLRREIEHLQRELQHWQQSH